MVGGLDNDDPEVMSHRSELVDPATGRISVLPDLLLGRLNQSVTTGWCGRVAVIGGTGLREQVTSHSIEPEYPGDVPKKVLFLDESGDHSLTKIDPQYSVFVLGGVVVDEAYLPTLDAEVRRFKIELLGRDDIQLHTADIVRAKNGFEALEDPASRVHFQEGLSALVRGLSVKVVACAIKKDAHLARYGMRAVDPYMLSLDVLVERFCYEIGPVENGGYMIAEKRDPTLDHQLELAWLNLKIQGTGFVQAVDIEKRVSSLTLQNKKANLAGLQIADLVVSPIGRHVLGKRDRGDFAAVESRFRRKYDGTYLGRGLVVLPR